MAEEAMTANNGEEQPPEAVLVPIKPPTLAAMFQAAALPLGMVMAQVLTVVMLLLSKLALNTGMRPVVFIVYRNLIGAAAVAPLAFVFEREMWKKLNLVVLGWVSLNATFGVVLATGLYYYGLQATNPAYSAIFLNLIPIATFVIGIVVGAERMALGKWGGRMKVVGAVTCVGGTMMVSLLKGRLLHLWPTTHLLLKSSHDGGGAPASGGHHDGLQVAGTLFLCGSCLSYALWFNVQARLGKAFPSKYWPTTLTCLSGSFQSFVLGVILNHDREDWRLKWDLQLLTIVYSGVLNMGISFVVISWAVSRRGPSYPPMFNSVSLVMTTLMDSLLLGTNIYVGSVVGMVLITVGLYAFLWGEANDLQASKEKLIIMDQQQHRGGVEMTA